ncbi:cell division protein ZapD [Alteromonas sp. ASW11-36]|uniref:Cell division protein ZapD n=1 Tax=Alteromonas arenosi TaxID=3055817 RepID=A0ABT7STL1_9ALTE|nr:cell division protein ZapD [Alteromonas sp. ASW11-36]MDM7859543.1 cell division protein ZapD [Alteromonas sp. ASW11-36]
MSTAVYEFPLNEKVRNYLRIEQLLSQIKSNADAFSASANIHFFEDLFTLLDLLERLDIRNDILKDIDAQERNLVHWSQHPNINNEALQQTLETILRLREALKQNKRIGSDLKEHPFISSIRQRFAIPGGSCSFDLPNLHHWTHLPAEQQAKDKQTWLQTLHVIDNAIALTLSFLRQRGNFTTVEATNGFFPGLSDDRGELVRIKLAVGSGCYPTLSGNKYRYALRFMHFGHGEDASKPVEQTLSFEIASC